MVVDGHRKRTVTDRHGFVTVDRKHECDGEELYVAWWCACPGRS